MINLVTIFDAMCSAVVVSQIYAMEQEVTAGGITTRVWQVFLQTFLLSYCLDPLRVVFPLAIDTINLVSYGGLLVSALLAYGASIFHSNEKLKGIGQPDKIQVLPYDLHNNKTLGKVLMFANEYCSSVFVLVYLSGLLLCGLNGFGAYALISLGMGVVDRAMKYGWLPSFLNAPYRWLSRLIFLTTICGLGSPLTIVLTALFTGFTIWEYVQTHIRGVRSSSWQYPIAVPEKAFHLSKLGVVPTQRDDLVELARTFGTYNFTVTYDHFRASHVVTQKILSTVSSVKLEGFTECFERVDFNNEELTALIGAEITAQDKLFSVPRDERIKNLGLPGDASDNDIHIAYLKMEMKTMVDIISKPRSNDIPAEAWSNTQKQAKLVLVHLMSIEHKQPDVYARALVEIALKTGNHCNRMYANTFTELFLRFMEQPLETLSLKERAALAMRAVREKAFNNYYHEVVPRLIKVSPGLQIHFADINDYHSYNNFSLMFGSEYYLSSNNGIRSARDIFDVINDAMFFPFLNGIKACFTDFYNLDYMINEALDPTNHLHTIFKEWCNNFYPTAYNEMVLDENMYPDLDNPDLKLLAHMMLLDLDIIELDRPYVPIASAEKIPQAAAPAHFPPLFTHNAGVSPALVSVQMEQPNVFGGSP
jgi:hypothetical protein